MPGSSRSRPPLQQLIAAFGMLLMLAGTAVANVCRSIEAELATGGRAPSVREQQMAQRSAVEAQRLFAHMQAIGCDRSGFLFFAVAPPECRVYRAQFAELQAQSQAGSPLTEARRRQLQSMLVTNNCRISARAPEPRSLPLTGGLFDDGIRRPGELDSSDIDPPPVVPRVRGNPVCVRLCDGYFFPLGSRSPSLLEDGDALCQALCPASDTRVFFQSGNIEGARNSNGELYGDMRNAFRYRKTYDASCACRQQGETWGERQSVIINPDNPGQPHGFDILNGEPADQADAPLRGMTPIPGRQRDERLFGNRAPPAPKVPPKPPDVPADKVVPADQGEMREIRGRDGVKRSVRVIAPELSLDPSAAKTPPVPGRGPSP